MRQTAREYVTAHRLLTRIDNESVEREGWPPTAVLVVDDVQDVRDLLPLSYAMQDLS